MRMLWCPIMDLYTFCWKPGKRVASYNALIARMLRMETKKKVLVDASYNALIERGDA